MAAAQARPAAASRGVHAAPLLEVGGGGLAIVLHTERPVRGSSKELQNTGKWGHEGDTVGGGGPDGAVSGVGGLVLQGV